MNVLFRDRYVPFLMDHSKPQLAEYGAKGLTLVGVDTLGAVPKLGLAGIRLDVIGLSGVIVIRWLVIARVFPSSGREEYFVD